MDAGRFEEHCEAQGYAGWEGLCRINLLQYGPEPWPLWRARNTIDKMGAEQIWLDKELKSQRAQIHNVLREQYNPARQWERNLNHNHKQLGGIIDFAFRPIYDIKSHRYRDYLEFETSFFSFGKRHRNCSGDVSKFSVHLEEATVGYITANGT